uniref:F-box/LRR-repeat protein 15/At3g58940/PEG3-like LRR domain-containing protein n=1 Tax=Aegilops tauschii TaxID=37682 RepID=M8C9T4_AEGTA
MYVPPLSSLPCAATTLRVLELHHCDLQPPAPSTEPSTCLAFPCLTDLSLRGCTYLQGYLQAVVDAAPALTMLALVDVTNKPPKLAGSGKRDRYEESKSFNLPLHLRSPTVTTLVLETNDSREDELEESRNIGIQLDMPSLRSFRYKGFPVKLWLPPPVPGLARVNLDTCLRERSFYKCEPVAAMLASFSSTRALKLHLVAIEAIISDPDEDSSNQNPGEATILPTFPNLKLLEIHGLFKYRNNNTALALATLLRACPALSELRLRLNMASDYHYNRKTEEREAGGPFALSVERFKRLGSMCAEHRDDVDLGAVSNLADPFTNSCTFGCLRTSLRKVTLQFKSKEVNCFQVQLAKFLVENAMVLEEMHVEDGDQFWPDHLWDKLTRWRADVFRRRNLPDTAAGFRVYQLANHVEDPRSLQLPFSIERQACGDQKLLRIEDLESRFQLH